MVCGKGQLLINCIATHVLFHYLIHSLRRLMLQCVMYMLSICLLMLQCVMYIYRVFELTCCCRYSLLTPETYPHWHGTVTEGIKHLMQAVNMEPDQWQLGRTKVFVKSPESVSHSSTLSPRPTVGHFGLCASVFSCWSLLLLAVGVGGRVYLSMRVV